jgi:hypothetical protein
VCLKERTPSSGDRAVVSMKSGVCHPIWHFVFRKVIHRSHFRSFWNFLKLSDARRKEFWTFAHHNLIFRCVFQQFLQLALDYSMTELKHHILNIGV